MAHRISRPCIELLEDCTLMATCQVTRLTDQGNGVGLRGELRYCINKANMEPGPDLINFRVTGTIYLAGGLLALASDMHIDGPGADQLTVRRSTGGNYRVFTISNNANVELSGLKITGGYLTSNSAGVTGAGIRNNGTLTLRNSHVTENQLYTPYGGGTGSGAGIYNSGSLLLLGSTVAHNLVSTETAYAYGGGVANHGELTVIDSTIADNDAITGDDHCHVLSDAIGGGIYNAPQATVSVYHSLISRNVAYNTCEGVGVGSGIYNGGAAVIFNSTIHWNDFFTVKGWTLISHSTIAAYTYYGVFADNQSSLFMRNTIVAGSSTSDVKGTLTSSGYNLISKSGQGVGYAPTDILDVDPMLGPLTDNGGPTFTMALLPGSPAIDAGDNTDAPDFDQRGPGFPRIVNDTIDIGAFEVQSTSAPKPPSLVYEAFRGAVLGPPLRAGFPMAIAAATPFTGFLEVRLEPTSADGSSPTARSLVNEADQNDATLFTRRQRRAYYHAGSPVNGTPADDVAFLGALGFVKVKVH